MTTEQEREGKREARRGVFWVETFLILAAFVCHGGWPPPDNNESHYLAKARHFWDPQWIPNDAFLNSADSHVVFYALTGWLPGVFSFAAAAWIGRVIIWGFMAWSWARLSFAVIPRPGAAAVTAALFVFFSEHFMMAGEWVVGGFEAKGFAYAFAFLAIEQALRGRWNHALAAGGAATAVHVLVGGWTLVAFAFAWIFLGESRPRLRDMTWGIATALVGAAIGMVPAVALSWSADSAMAAEASRIYVFERLSHHLWIFEFEPMGVARLSLLALFTFSVMAAFPADETLKRLRLVVAGSIVISLVGFAISLVLINDPERAATIARFYWYRLSDAFVPMGAAITSWAYADWALRQRPVLGRALTLALLLTAFGYVGWAALTHVGAQNARTEKPGRIADPTTWIAACAYIREELPKNAVVLTPRGNQSFHWRAERAEVASMKNVPQEARAIVNWWRRIHDVYGKGAAPPDAQWYGSLSDQTPEALRAIAERYGADYLLTEAEPGLPFEHLYGNDAYTVYRIERGNPPADAGK